MQPVLPSLLMPQRLTEIVDIGANPVDGVPPYGLLLESGQCRVTGFEPQPDALKSLLERMGPNERYLPYAVGDGEEHMLHVCSASGMTSLFEPDPAVLALFDDLRPHGEVLHREPIRTRRLDDIDEVGEFDLLKIDIQGGELAVFQNGRNKLAKAVVVQTEVAFLTLYKGQPGFGEIDVELRAQGFVPHCFAVSEDMAVKQWPISPCVVNNHPRWALNQLLEADLVYIRDISRPEALSDEQLKQMAMIVHHCYRSFDLALRCLVLLEERGAVGPGTPGRYVQAFNRVPAYGNMWPHLEVTLGLRPPV